jgi:hypothetical protein
MALYNDNYHTNLHNYWHENLTIGFDLLLREFSFFNAVLLHLASMSVYSLQIINMSLPQKYNLLSITFIEIISQLPALVEDYNTVQFKGILNTRQTLMERRYKSKYDKSCVI